jgi:hypothetical protein
MRQLKQIIDKEQMEATFACPASGSCLSVQNHHEPNPRGIDKG